MTARYRFLNERGRLLLSRSWQSRTFHHIASPFGVNRNIGMPHGREISTDHGRVGYGVGFGAETDQLGTQNLMDNF